MMTRKDYIRASEIIRLYPGDSSLREVMMKAFVEFFVGDNPCFDIQRFLMACEPKRKK
jgi:hypothetical protein